MSTILQCLVHCVPLQRYFLNDIGHNHEACTLYRTQKYASKAGSKDGVSTSESSKGQKTAESICLACEMDRLFLRYTGSAIGVDLMAVVGSDKGTGVANRVAPTGRKEVHVIQGDPLVTADMLTAAWKCGGMKHLAGYQQRDAHEFLHGFLEILGRHTLNYRTRMYRAINTARPLNSYVDVSGRSPSEFGTFDGIDRETFFQRKC